MEDRLRQDEELRKEHQLPQSEKTDRFINTDNKGITTVFSDANP